MGLYDRILQNGAHYLAPRILHCYMDPAVWCSMLATSPPLYLPCIAHGMTYIVYTFYSLQVAGTTQDMAGWLEYMSTPDPASHNGPAWHKSCGSRCITALRCLSCAACNVDHDRPRPVPQPGQSRSDVHHLLASAVAIARKTRTHTHDSHIVARV